MSVKTAETTDEQEELEDDVSSEEVSSNEDDKVDEDKLQILRKKLEIKLAAKEAEEKEAAKEDSAEESVEEPEEKKEEMPPRIIEKQRRSIEFGIVGSGQAGSRLAESFYKLGYTSICFNTAPQDLEFIAIPEDNKYLLDHGIGGAAKELDIGSEAAEKHRDGINQLVHEKLADAQILLLCISLGGGSGAGSCETMIDILVAMGRPVAVITVLPMSTDDAQTKNNALETLSKLSRYAQDKTISNLIVVDNAKIETIYNDVGTMDFFKVSNRAIVEPIHIFNEFTSRSSEVKGLDPMEFAKIFVDGEGLTVYGEMTISDYEDSMAIAEAVINNLSTGLLASGFDLKQTRYAGCIFVANKKVWDNVSSGSVNMAMELIRDVCGHAEGVFKGIYIDDEIEEDVVKIYSMFSGLGLPDARVKQLKKEAKAEAAKSKDRADARNMSLELDTGEEQTVSQADKIRKKVKRKSAKFGKVFGSGTSVKDLRKK